MSVPGTPSSSLLSDIYTSPLRAPYSAARREREPRECGSPSDCASPRCCWLLGRSVDTFLPRLRGSSGSTKARMVWVPLITFLKNEAVRTRIREYAAICGEPELRKEIETVLEESKKW